MDSAEGHIGNGDRNSAIDVDPIVNARSLDENENESHEVGIVGESLSIPIENAQDPLDVEENPAEAASQPVADTLNDENDDIVVVDGADCNGPSEKEKGLPLARIRSIINADEDVGIVSKAAVILITKATELFISQLASDAARHISGSKRKTIQLDDISEFPQFCDFVDRNVFISDAVTGMCDEYAFLDGISLGESTKLTKQPKSKVANAALSEVNDSPDPQDTVADAS